MDAPIVRGLNDKLYDRRKAAALELEKVIQQSDSTKISTIINQLCQMFTSPTSPLHTRNGGLIGLAATAIALGMDFSSWLGVVVPRVLGCFGDGESRVRYYACESLYNIAKVCKGEILVHFNGIFDALSKLSADSEASVKNGAELLDRLLKDIVSETALNYVSRYPENVDRTFGWVEMEHPSVGHGGIGEWGYQGRLRASLAAEREKERKHPLEESPDMKPMAMKDPPPMSGSMDKESLAPGRSVPKSDGSLTRDTSPHSAGVIHTKDGSMKTTSISGSSVHIRRQSQSQAPSSAGFVAHHAGTSTSSTQLQAPQTAPVHRGSHSSDVSPHSSLPSAWAHDQESQPRLAFSLAKFIPLLSERIYVISPFTRSHLVSWIMVLDSVPDLELVSYLPEFLDGLLKYLSDPSPDVKIATEAVLKDFLREIRHIANVQRRQLESGHASARSPAAHQQGYNRRTSAVLRRRASKLTMETENSELDSVITGTNTNTIDGDGNVLHMSPDASRMDELKEEDPDAEHEDSSVVHDPDEVPEYDYDEKAVEHSAWIPGQGVFVDHAAIMDIMIQHVAYPDDQISSQALRWISSFLTFVQDVMIGFTPRLIPAVLPNLAHHAPSIQSAASETNQLLYHAIQALPAPSTAPPQTGNLPGSVPGPSPSAGTHTVSAGQSTGSQSTIGPDKNTSPSNRRDGPGTDASMDGSALALANEGNDSLRPSFSSAISLGTAASTMKPKAGTAAEPGTPVGFEFPSKLRPGSPSALPPTTQGGSPAVQQPAQPYQVTVANTQPTFDDDLFDIRETVNQLTLQFLSEHEETRVAALEWLLMLHQKAPKRILTRDDGTFPVLLKTLSDPSEEVVKHDLQLLAQISATSEDSYFSSFLVNLLELFSTDRRLLETRGSLIIRQLCLNMNTERIFRTFAEVLEREEDLEFAGLMVVKLNMILITSPELADFRKRLKNLESKDGQMLFTAIYKSWCHNAVAVFALCLLAQAYEHASNLLQIFAELEMTVPLLVQIDKLVMLIESPVFTALRLQLLEPERHPFLFKCLYGLLMLLPQSSAFVSLRNRLSAVSSMGFLHIPKASYTPSVATTRSKISTRDEIKWQELLSHFRQVQNKHEKARRQSQAGEANHGHSMSGFNFSGPSASNSPNASGTGRRRLAGSGSRKESANSNSSVRAHGQSTLSPLNPRRAGSSSASGSLSALALGAPFGTTMSNGQRSRSPTMMATSKRKILPGLRR